MRDRVQQHPRRRVLRTPEARGADRRDGRQPALDRHRLFAARARGRRQGPDRLDRLRPYRRLRRARLPLCLSAHHQLLEPGHGDRALHRRARRRDGQAEGQEDREPLSRFGLRQGDDADPRGARGKIRLPAAQDHIAVPHPGNDQQSQWLEIREWRPDWVILRGWGVMNPTALKTAAKVGFPRDHIVGNWWTGSEEDVIPAGSAAKGFLAAGFHPGGAGFPVLQDIKKYVLDRGESNLEDRSRFGSIYYNRGVIHGIINVEAIRVAQERFGHQPLTGEQVRWGLEHLKFDEPRLKALGAAGLLPPFSVSCADHEGGGAVEFQQWDGARWKLVSDWIATDQSLVRPMIERSAAHYASEHGIAPRDCGKDGCPPRLSRSWKQDQGCG